MLDPARLVFIDETAVSTNMVRLRGRAPRGVRLVGHVPLGQWKTITFVAALRHNKMTAPMVIEGAMTGEMFLAYVEQCLVPTLRRDDIVVMDNLPSPQGRRHPRGDRESAGDTSLSAEVLARPQSHRAVLQQIQSVAAQGCRAHRSGVSTEQFVVRTANQRSGMRQLLGASTKVVIIS